MKCPFPPFVLVRGRIFVCPGKIECGAHKTIRAHDAYCCGVGGEKGELDGHTVRGVHVVRPNQRLAPRIIAEYTRNDGMGSVWSTSMEK